jgi:hypothetical protein
MKKSVSFGKDIEARLLEYRKARKEETGKMMFRETAICELLQIALQNYSPPMPIEDRLREIEQRLAVLEIHISPERETAKP